MALKQNKKVYFVRHGQSTDNVSPVFSSIDGPLSEKGKLQAKSIADRLSNIEFEALISSPQLRAKQTAEFISKKMHKDITISDLFVERIKPPEINGKSWEDKEANDIWRAWEANLYGKGKRVGGGESFNDIVSRADKALKFLLSRPESSIAVVTHGFFLRVIVARVLIGKNLNGDILKHFQEHASVENTAITVLDYRDAFEQSYEWRLWTLNDHSHFAE